MVKIDIARQIMAEVHELSGDLLREEFYYGNEEKTI